MYESYPQDRINTHVIYLFALALVECTSYVNQTRRHCQLERQQYVISKCDIIMIILTCLFCCLLFCFCVNVFGMHLK